MALLKSRSETFPPNTPDPVNVTFIEKVEWGGGGHQHLERTFEAGKTYAMRPDYADRWVTYKQAYYTDSPIPDWAKTAAEAHKTNVAASDDEKGTQGVEKDSDAATDDSGDSDVPDAAKTTTSKGIIAPDADKSQANRGNTKTK